MTLSAPESSSGASPPAHTPFDAVCAAFEQGWRSGDRPAIEAYLQGTAPVERTSLLSLLIRIEVRERLRRGETPRPEEYETRFPEDRDTVLGLNWTTLASPEALAAATANFSTLLLPASSQRVRVGRFELLNRLGVGGFGEVWRAFDTHLQREVALKIGHLNDSDPTRAPLLLHEAKSAGRLRHPGIVPVHDAGLDGDSAYIVSELVTGTDLCERLKAGPFAFREAAELARKVAEAVAHAHDHGVVHRDIKPANVLLDDKGEPHLTDFGIARRSAGDQTISHIGQVLGSPAYMAPEQARGDVAAVDHRSDVYSLGIVLYEMLAGRRAFPGDARESLKRVLEGPPEPLRQLRKDVPRDLERIVNAATARERSDRYQTAAALADDLGRYLRGEPILARRVSILERSGRFVRKHPLSLAVPVVVVAAYFGPLFVQPDPVAPGTRRVTITTEPPNAEMAFVPLDPATGEPQPERMVRPGRSPVELDLPPGDYIVVAALDEKKFHEVYRHVPPVTEMIPASGRHRRWTRTDAGVIQLSAITIPTLPVSGKMARIEGTDSFESGIAGSTLAPAHKIQIHSFYLDPFEFTWKDLAQLGVKVSLPDTRIEKKPPNYAINASYDSAMDLAELVGKRLPTSAELEFAATARGAHKFPWGDSVPDAPARETAKGIGPVGTPEFDRLEMEPPVYGLVSNVAEWTTSWAVPHPSAGAANAQTLTTLDSQQYRCVAGGTGYVLRGDSEWTAELNDPRRRSFVDRYRIEPGLGFRFARSAKPRLMLEDWISVKRPAVSPRK